MMLISAVLEPSTVDRVKRALRLFDVRGMTLSRVLVPARRPRVEMYRGGRWPVTMLPRVRLDLLASNADAPDLARVVYRAAQRDVRVWVTQVDELVRIRTGERGLDAL
jgi:nitrogen regulatory protein P-II 1